MTGLRATYTKPMAFNVTRLAHLTTTIIGNVGGSQDRDFFTIARGDSETWREIPDAIAAQGGADVNHLRLMVGEKVVHGAIIMGDQTLSSPLQHLILHHVDIAPIRQQLIEEGAAVADLIANFWSQYKTAPAYVAQQP